LWGLLAAGGQAMLFFSGLGIAGLKAIGVGAAMLFLAMPLMLYLASTLMKWCAGILSGADLDTAKIKETVETVTALIGGLGLIAVGMAAAVYGMYALGLGAGFIVFNPLILGAIAAGAVALNYGLPFFLELSASVFKFCSKIISGTGLDKKQIDETTETIKSLFGGLGTLIFQLWKTGGMILYLLNPINIGLISLAFGVFLPYATEMISGISVFIIDFVKALGKLIKNVSNQVGGLKGVEFLAKFSEDMTKAIISVIEMVRVIGSSLVPLTAPKYIFWGNSVMEDIKKLSAGFSESMEVICRDVVKKGIIDPILNNFNKSGMKQTSQALRASVLISKALSSVADMLVTLSDIVTYFGKDVGFWTPWRNPSIEQIKELGMSFSKHFATIITTLNTGIIQPLVDNFKNLKSLGIAASAAKGIGAVFSGIAEFLKAYSEQIKPLTDKKGYYFFQTSGIEDIKTSLDSLSAPLTAIYGGVKTLVQDLNIGKKDMKDLDKILPSLDMFTKLAAAMGTMSNQMLNLQKNTEKTEYDTDNSIMANIYGLRSFTTGISKADKAAKGSKDMGKVITGIILDLSSVIDAMEAALKSSKKDPKSLEESIKRFEQLTTITSKVSSMINDYNTSAKTANEIKTNKNGGFAGASKNIKEAVDQTYDFVKIITKAIDTKGKYQEIQNAFAAVTGLSHFMKSMFELIKNISESMESLHDLDTEMKSIGNAVGKDIITDGTSSDTFFFDRDKLKNHLKEIVTFVVGFSSSIIEVLKAQKLPDVKGMEQEVEKLNILIEAIASVGTMMLHLKRLNEVQDELNKQLGGGKVQAQGVKTPFLADRGDKIKDIKTSMGENIKTVIELSSGIIETIQKLPIGDLKGVSEAVKKLEECINAVAAVRFLFLVINGDEGTKGLNEIMQELEVSLAKSESSGGGGDFGENIPTAISGIKNSLGKPITQVLELLQTIISEVGGKLSGLKGDEVQKLIFIGNMLQVFKNITSSIKTLFLDQTEIIEDPVTKTKKLASVSEAIANGQTDFVKYIGSIGSLIKGIVDAIKDPNNFADAGSVEQVKSKMLPTLEIMENLAEMLVEINQHIRNIYKNYRDVAINACIGFSSDGPMAHIGTTINFKIVQDIINNFPTVGDLDESLDISYETLQRLNRMVYNLQGIHIKVEQIYKDYKASAGAYAEINNNIPINDVSITIWNKIVIEILKNFASQSDWQRATGMVEDTSNGLQIISQNMSLIHMEVEQIYKDYKANISIYNGLRDESIFKVVGIAIWNHIVNSIFANFAEKSHWERATAMVEMTADALEFMKHHMSSIKESCEELISLNENFAEILNSNAIETIGKSILENILDPIEIFMPSNEKIGKTVKRIDMITTGIMMLSDSLMLLKNSIESIGNLGSSIGNMFSNFIGFGKEISQPIDSKINILSEPSEQFTDQKSINSEPRNLFTDQRSINSEPRSSFTDLQKSINSEPRSSFNNQEWNKRSTSTNRYSADESLSSKFRGDGMSDDEMKQRMIASAAGIDPSEISMPSKKAFTDENQWNKRSMATKPYSIDESLSSKFRGDGMSADEMKQNIITSSSGVDVANEIRREKATSEVNVKPSYSMDEINNVANLQLKEQQKMVELLQKINDKMEQEKSTSNPSGDSDLGDSDTASRKINRKPINLYKWGTGQFHRGAGVGMRNTGDGGPK
jgi:DNA repair ATPase RecN